MAKYKQKGFNAGEGTGSSKKIDHAKRYPDHGEGDKVHTYSDVFSMKSPTGPYSTVEGDLMSGRDAGLGEFGQTDTKIGGLGRSGKQRIGRGFRQTDVASSLDGTMANKPRTSRISADMSAVDVVEEKGPSRKELRQQKRAQRQAEREAKRAERKKKRLAAREARRARRA